eukprot:403347926
MQSNNSNRKRKGACKRLFRPIDIYAKPIQLTYQGNGAFNTTFGGIISAVVVLSLMSISFYKVNDMVEKNLSVVKKNTLVSVSNSYVPPEDISKKNITFAFMLSDLFAESVFNDPYYGKFVLRQSIINIKTNQTDGSSSREFIDLIIPYSKCEVGKNIFYPNVQEIKQYNIQNYFCPDWQNLTLQGNWYSPEFKVITLLFVKCTGVNCASDEELKVWLTGKWIQQVIISSYFDIQSYEDPVNYFLDDSYLAIEYGRTTFNTMYIKKDLLRLSDNLIGFFNEIKNDIFYQMSHSRYFTSTDEGGPGKGIYFYQDIKLDKEYDVYERQVYSVSSLLQDIGGFYNSLFFIGLIIFSKLQESIFFSTLISKLYQIELVKGSRFYSNTFESQQVDLESTNGRILIDGKSQIDSPSNLNKELNSSKVLTQNLQQELEGNKWNISKVINRKLVSYLGNRWRVNLTSSDIFSFAFLKLYTCCGRRKIKIDQTSSLSKRKLYLFKKGQGKIQHELDAINLMTKLRKLDLLLSLTLNKDQSYLLQFQKKHLIQDHDSSSSEGDQDLNSSKVVRKFTEESFYNPGQNQVMQQRRRLEDALIQLQGTKQLSIIDKKIILGLLTRKTMKFDDQSVMTKDNSPKIQRTTVRRKKSDSSSEFTKKFGITNSNTGSNGIIKNEDIVRTFNQGEQEQYQISTTKLKTGFFPHNIVKNKSNKNVLEQQSHRPKNHKKRSFNYEIHSKRDKNDKKDKKFSLGLKDILSDD